MIPIVFSKSTKNDLANQFEVIKVIRSKFDFRHLNIPR